MASAKKRKIRRRGPQSKEVTRESLIASGIELFAERGLDGPSLDDICAHAGLTRGAFYVHFEDRDDFLLAVMDKVGAELLDELLARGSGGFAEAVQRFVEASASGRYPLMPKGGIRPYQLLDACARSPIIRERYMGLVGSSVARVADLIAEGQGAGILRKDVRAESAATLTIAVIVGLQTLADLGMDVPLESLAPEVIALLAAPPTR